MPDIGMLGKFLDGARTTTTALFILDALGPVTGEALSAAADDLVAQLTRLGPDVQTARRLITASPGPVAPAGQLS